MSSDRINKVDYIEIPTRDIQASKAFFAELFGWQFEDYGADYTSFDDGRLTGGFFTADTTASVATGSVLVVFYLADLEAAVAKVESLGGSITQAIFSFPGGRRFHFTSPSGNEFAIWSDM
ncbi:MAG: VOC family protein [Cyanobacteria bacterium J06639_14]